MGTINKHIYVIEFVYYTHENLFHSSLLKREVKIKLVTEYKMPLGRVSFLISLFFLILLHYKFSGSVYFFLHALNVKLQRNKFQILNISCDKMCTINCVSPIISYFMLKFLQAKMYKREMVKITEIMGK